MQWMNSNSRGLFSKEKPGAMAELSLLALNLEI